MVLQWRCCSCLAFDGRMDRMKEPEVHKLLMVGMWHAGTKGWYYRGDVARAWLGWVNGPDGW